MSNANHYMYIIVLPTPVFPNLCTLTQRAWEINKFKIIIPIFTTVQAYSFSFTKKNGKIIELC